MITYEELDTLIKENRYEEVYGILCEQIKEYLSIITGRNIDILSLLAYTYYLYDNFEDEILRIYKIITSMPSKTNACEFYDILIDLISKDAIRSENRKDRKKKIMILVRNRELEFAIRLYKESIIYEKFKKLLEIKGVYNYSHQDLNTNELSKIVEDNYPKFKHTCEALRNESYSFDYLDTLLNATITLSPYDTELIPDNDLNIYFENNNFEPLIQELKEVFISLILVVEDKDDFSEDLDELLKTMLESSKIKNEYKEKIKNIFEINNLENIQKVEKIKELRTLYNDMKKEYLEM